MVLAWTDNSAVEDGYEVERAPWGGEYSVIANLPANATSYRDSQVNVDVRYFYYVRAKKDGGFSDQSNFVNGVVASGPPLAPVTDAVASSTTSIDVTWTATSSNADGFRIERSTDDGFSWISAGTVGGHWTRFSDTDRTAEQRVCYRVLAFNSTGDSAPSNVDCTSTTVGPTNLTATAVNSLTVDLAWTDNSNTEDGYIVVRINFLIQESWFVIAELPSNATSYRDEDLWFGPGTYTYQVAAKKDCGVPDYPNEAVNMTPGAASSATRSANPGGLTPSRAAHMKPSTRTRARR